MNEVAVNFMKIVKGSVRTVRHALRGKGGQQFVTAHILKQKYHTKSVTGGRGVRKVKKSVTYYLNDA